MIQPKPFYQPHWLVPQYNFNNTCYYQSLRIFFFSQFIKPFDFVFEVASLHSNIIKKNLEKKKTSEQLVRDLHSLL